MEMIPITADRKAQLDAYAQRHGQDAAAALDSVLEDYLAWEAEDRAETLAALREGFADIEAGRTQPVEQMFEELRQEYGFPRQKHWAYSPR
jgi:predicted transcriptional regulator